MAVYNSLESIPMILNAKDIQAILGISKGKTYELMNTKDFPTIYLNKRMVVTREAFFDWLNQDKLKIRRRAIHATK